MWKYFLIYFVVVLSLMGGGDDLFKTRSKIKRSMIEDIIINYIIHIILWTRQNFRSNLIPEGCELKHRNVLLKAFLSQTTSICLACWNKRTSTTPPEQRLWSDVLEQLCGVRLPTCLRSFKLIYNSPKDTLVLSKRPATGCSRPHKPPPLLSLAKRPASPEPVPQK